jgi:hypothetical protein
VEIKIGVQYATRELVLEMNKTVEEISAGLQQALGTTGGVLDLTDERGRRVLVPGDKIAFIEIGEPEVRRVGFGAV